VETKLTTGARQFWRPSETPFSLHRLHPLRSGKKSRL